MICLTLDDGKIWCRHTERDGRGFALFEFYIDADRRDYELMQEAQTVKPVDCVDRYSIGEHGIRRVDLIDVRGRQCYTLS